MPLHLMHVVRPPEVILDRLERIFNGFLWGSSTSARKWHWGSWAKACYPVEEGGLGFRRLKDVALAFDINLWWRFRDGDSLWSRYMKERYCQGADPSTVVTRSGLSPLWRRLLKIRTRAEAETSSSFSFRDTWGAIRQHSSTDPFFAQLWGKLIPASASFFLWRLRHRWLPFEDTLQSRGFQLASACPCHKGPDSPSHLFFDCEVARNVWRYFAVLFHVRLPASYDLDALVNAWKLRPRWRVRGHVRELLPFLVLWFLWTLQNDVRHRPFRMTSSIVFSRIRSHLRTLHISHLLLPSHWKGYESLQNTLL